MNKTRQFFYVAALIARANGITTNRDTNVANGM